MLLSPILSCVCGCCGLFWGRDTVLVVPAGGRRGASCEQCRKGHLGMRFIEKQLRQCDWGLLVRE